jgi:DNA-binding GntR family transcriptional regulator
MSVVDLWRSDQHLPQNVKKMAVRAVLPKLVHEKLLKRGTQRTEFVIRRTLTN